MNRKPRKITLGYTNEDFGYMDSLHICHLYSSDTERQDALTKIILSGLRSNEKIGCFSDKVSDSSLSEYLQNSGYSYRSVINDGALEHASTGDIYFQNNEFNPDRLLIILRKFYDKALEKGFESARIIGEMLPSIQNISGGSRLLEYESRVSLFLRECPMVTVCQYDSVSFSGGTIMDILKMHPLMIVRDSIVHNPFFIRPEEFLAKMA